MQVFFQRYLWTLNLVVVAIAGVMSARTVSAVAAARLAQPPSAEPSKTARPALTNVRSTVDPKALAAIFGMTVPDPEAAPAEVEPETTPGDEVPTTINATLVATIVADPEDYSAAVITDNNSRETSVYGIGDLLQGAATVVKVEERRVLLNNRGRTEYLEMDGEAKPGATAGGAVAAVTPASADKEEEKEGEIGDGIRKVAENEYVVAQEEIEKTLSNLNTIATQARIVPAFKNGVAQGFKLFSIRPGSLYAKIGIQNGDVIKKINGYDINSPDKALEVYQKLKDARDVTVELERRGRTVKKSYSIE
ncbi:MAG: type II secretion system protein GspC [Deltaproteobacteria bacterium]|nr:type II secretion system protein GspC [Deltaproteobacteria bacterium]